MRGQVERMLADQAFGSCIRRSSASMIRMIDDRTCGAVGEKSSSGGSRERG
jgi:hypothetical protein